MIINQKTVFGLKLWFSHYLLQMALFNNIVFIILHQMQHSGHLTTYNLLWMKITRCNKKSSKSPIYHKLMETSKVLSFDEPKYLLSYSSYFASLWARQSLNMGYFSCIHSALSDQIWIEFYRRLFEHWETICDLCQM